LDKGRSAKEAFWTSDIVLAIVCCFLSIVVVATIRSVRRGLPLNGRGQAQDTKKRCPSTSGISMIMDVCSLSRSVTSIPDARP
jgi:hypothetical protein